MKAARYYGPKDIRVEEIDKPVPKTGQVLIKVTCVVHCFSPNHFNSSIARSLGKYLERFIAPYKATRRRNGSTCNALGCIITSSTVLHHQVCGTDLHAYLARTPKFPTATEPDPITGETLPVTLGHE